MSHTDLVNWFGEMISCHSELETYATDKRKAIITNDMNELDVIVKGEQKNILAIRSLEMKREQIVSNLLANRYQLKKTMKLSDLLPLFNEKEQDEINEKAQTLSFIITSIKKQNEENNSLLKQSLYFTNRMLGALTPEQRTKNGTYGMNGKIDYKKQTGQFSSSI